MIFPHPAHNKLCKTLIDSCPQSFITHDKFRFTNFLFKVALQLLHGGDIGGLDKVFKLLDLLLELVRGDLVVLNDQVDLQLLDTEADGDQLGSTPDQTVLFDATDRSLQSSQISLVICNRTC